MGTPPPPHPHSYHRQDWKPMQKKGESFNISFLHHDTVVFILILALWHRDFHYERYIGISPYRTLAVVELQSMAFMSYVTWSCEKIQTLFIWVRYGKIQHMSNKQGVRLKARTLFIGWELYFPHIAPFAYPPAPTHHTPDVDLKSPCYPAD